LNDGQEVIQKFKKALKATGNIQILFGNLAEEGCVAKLVVMKESILKEMLLFMKMSMMSSPAFAVVK
jgi:dihydroxyacid dehydratase/phosphogluconate dehydratase